MLWVETRSDNPRPDFRALSDGEFYLAVMTLHDAGYVNWTRTEAEGGGSRYFQDFMVTGAGKQALGLWPRFDALGSPAELAAVLEALAEEAATEEERSNLKRAAAAVRRSAPELIKAGLIGALSTLARSQFGI
jgi:hypothetical protein